MHDDLYTLTHLGEEKSLYLNSVTPPVFMNSLHVYDTYEAFRAADAYGDKSFVYGRCGNPTTRILEDKLAALEHGTKAAVFASGMAAATSAIYATCRAGSHIICMRDVYHPVRRFLEGYAVPSLGMSVTYVVGTDLGEVERAIRPETALIILESPATFVFTVPDLQAIAQLARQRGIRTFIDNTFCTPLYQKPLDLGIDLSMHTLSKYIGGHSDIIGGALIGKDEQLMHTILTQIREWHGGIMGPMESWLAIRGLRTLDARLSRHQETAMAVARYLEQHPKVRKVYYTGLESHPQRALIARQQTGHTGLISFLPDCTPEQAIALINRLRLFGKGVSWGGFESLALVPLYPCSDEELAFLGMTEEKALVRIHCGLEGQQALLADLEQALAAI